MIEQANTIGLDQPSAMQQSSVFILDDDGAVRDALKMLVNSIGLNAIEYSSAESFLADYDEDTPGCLITDVYLPGMDGAALQKALNDQQSSLPMIVISGNGDIPLAVEMVKNGALDFMEKPFRNRSVVERIHQAISLDLQRREKVQSKRDWDQRFDSLTPREQEVLELLVHGDANKVIARKMDLSPRTIESHRASILKKMSAISVTALAQQIVRLQH